jgi:hypothetical protein
MRSSSSLVWQCWKHRRKASSGVNWSSAVSFYMMTSMVEKRPPLRPIFRVGNRQKITRSEIRRVRWLGDDTTSDVWLGALSWCRNHCPCLLLVVSLPPNCTSQPLQNSHVDMTSNTLSGRYELMAHQTVDVILLPLVYCSVHSIHRFPQPLKCRSVLGITFLCVWHAFQTM